MLCSIGASQGATGMDGGYGSVVDRGYAKVNMIADRRSGVLHTSVIGGRRSLYKDNMIAGR